MKTVVLVKELITFLQNGFLFRISLTYFISHGYMMKPIEEEKLHIYNLFFWYFSSIPSCALYLNFSCNLIYQYKTPNYYQYYHKFIILLSTFKLSFHSMFTLAVLIIVLNHPATFNDSIKFSIMRIQFLKRFFNFNFPKFQVSNTRF